MKKVQELTKKIVANVERVIIGKRAEIELALLALLCEGHVLIEDVPGVGKTMLARSIAKSIGCEFRRIQFTARRHHKRELFQFYGIGCIGLEIEASYESLLRRGAVDVGTTRGNGRGRRRCSCRSSVLGGR